MTALAELKTPDGTFLIQERRAVPREPLAPKPEAAPSHQSRSSTPSMSALGGLIIIGVLVASYTTKYDGTVGHANGPLAVPAVGFLALQLFLARAAYRLFNDIRYADSLVDYAQMRILRYLPAVIPAVILGFVLSQFAGIPSLRASATSLPANLLMIADMVGTNDIDSSHWRLKIEIFQAVMIGVSWFSPARRHIAAILLVCLGLSALYVAGEPVRQNTLSMKGVLTADGYLPFFAFGIALYQLAHEKVGRIWWAVAAASIALVFLSNTPWHGLATLSALAVLTGIVMGRLRFLGRIRWLVLLGELAFPIYVVHYVAGFSLIHRMELDGFNPIVAVLAASMMAIVLGKVVSVVFEKPAIAHGPAAFKALRETVTIKVSAYGRPAGLVGRAQATS